jgi:hypothetical protein
VPVKSAGPISIISYNNYLEVSFSKTGHSCDYEPQVVVRLCCEVPNVQQHWTEWCVALRRA